MTRQEEIRRNMWDYYDHLVENNLLHTVKTNYDKLNFLLIYAPSELIIELYEKYCRENEQYENILYPVHSIEDHFGPDVQDFLADNTDYLTKYAYYTINDDKVKWFREKEAISKAKGCLLENFQFVVNNY